MASIKRMNTKKGLSFKIVVCDGYESDGKKKVNTITFKPDQDLTPKQQEKAAQKFAIEFEAKVKNEYNFDGDKISFEKFSQGWLSNVKHNVTYSTYESYEQILRTRVIPYFGNFKIAKIKLRDIEKFYLTQFEGCAYGTVKKSANLLSGIFKFAIRNDLIQINPCKYAEIPKSFKKEDKLKHFTPKQSFIFLDSLNQEYETTYKAHDRIDDTGKPYRVNEYVESRAVPTQYKVFYNIALFCGLRKGEILALHWDDIDFDNKLIHITKSAGKTEDGIAIKKPKTKTSIRMVAIDVELIELLKQYKIEYQTYRLRLGTAWKGNGNLFTQDDGKLMGYSTPYQYFKKHIKRHNLRIENLESLAEQEKIEQLLPMIPLHGLRHSCATLLNYLKVNIITISKFLGHAQTSTTMDIYAHTFEELNREASEKMGGWRRAKA